MARIIDLSESIEQRKRWGKTEKWAYSCSLHELILEFANRFNDMKKDPFDLGLALWMDDLSIAVSRRCQNKDLLAMADKYLEHGTSVSFRNF